MTAPRARPDLVSPTDPVVRTEGVGFQPRIRQVHPDGADLLSMHTTSASLLVRLREAGQSDRMAWSRFVDLYTPLIYHWARRTGLSVDDARDLVQEVFLLLVRKMPEFNYNSEKSFRGWLRTVTLNKWRERQRRRSLPVVNVGIGDLEDVAGNAEDEAIWDAEYREHILGRALRHLRHEFPPVVWAAFKAHVIEGRSAREVADELSVSIWRVYGAKSRVIGRLRESWMAWSTDGADL